MKKNKKRLDVLLVEKGLFESREKAKASVMAGLVYVDDVLVDKPGTDVDESGNIVIKEKLIPYVSRGGLKLEKIIEEYGLELEGCVCMDIGASTGGFTDCMLQHGAAKVYAVDVGYGQLDWKLRNDDRVVNMEKVNVRYLDPETIPDRMDLISIDVSFISLSHVFPVASKLLKESGKTVALIKPQFEAGREKVGRGGIVRDSAVHVEVLERIRDIGRDNGLTIEYLTYSPIKGAKGNVEYLAVFNRSGEEGDIDIYETVRKGNSEAK